MKKIVFLLVLFFAVIAAKAQQPEHVVVISTNFGDMKCKLYNDTPKHRDKFLQEVRKGYYNGTLFYRVIHNFLIQGGAADSRNAPPGKRIGYGDPAFTVDDEIRPNHFHKKGALCAPRQPDKVNPFKQSDISQFYIVEGRVFRPGELDTMELANNVPIKQQIVNQILTPEIKAKLKKLKEEKKVKEFRALANPIKGQIETEYALNPHVLKFSKAQRKAYTTVGGYPELDRKYTVFGEVIDGFDVIDKIAAMKTDKNDRPLTDVKILNIKVIK
ncbi:peptidylprolyl isomerase [Prolixibacter denitrificans]|uniref:peptidylprolyl isomerase n=1 Tax=Prolixibacter denitrificans TaxID=1541063 RepID=A0A2P8CHK5_9BACT|nr:peptidylprolyl isomerase [Prolixibacter denitrificans]PSK84457.1 peptidyl-prolyl cis-trans isomerase B (cyclophilin B) [Prolixibacter denitrificans]GET20630.1 peptidyl-prolyl cis-trans isomerase [Prolixibacter denitrificans]